MPQGEGYFAIPTTKDRRPKPTPLPVAEKKTTLVVTVRDWMSESISGDKHNRDKALRDIKFLIGDEQWDAAARSTREADNRPVLTINKLPKFVRQVVGQYRSQRFAPKVSPKDDAADEATADILAGLLRFIIHDSQAQDAFTNGLKYAASCSMGYWRVAPRYTKEDAWDQELGVEMITDPFTVYRDPKSTLQSMEDARFVAVTSLVTRAEFERRWPGKSPSSVESGDGDQSDNFWVSTTQGEADAEFRVAEVWWREEANKKIALLSNHETADLTGMTPEAIDDMILMKMFEIMDAMMPDAVSLEGEEREMLLAELVSIGQMQQINIIKRRSTVSSVIKMGMFSGADQLETTVTWPGRHFPIILCHGEATTLDGVQHLKSLIRDGLDAQKAYNYTFSQAIETFSLTPKQPWLVDMGAISEYEHIWKRANQGNVAYLPYVAKPGIPPPTRGRPPEVPAAALSLGAEATAALTDTIGMFDPGMGKPSNETSGKAIQLRIQQGVIGSNIFADNMRAAIEHTARVILDLIPTYYDTDRTIYILNEDEEKVRSVAINGGLGSPKDPIFDITRGKYSVSISVGPNYATRNAEMLDGMIQFLQYLPPEVAAMVAPDIAKAADWPGAENMAKKVETMLGAGVTPEVLEAIQKVVMATIQQMAGEQAPQPQQ